MQCSQYNKSTLKQINVETLSLGELQSKNQKETFWVESDSQLEDVLTKKGASHTI